MRNFLRLAFGVNYMPLLHAVQRQPELWNENKLRTTHAASPHTEVDDIWLRFNDLTPYKDATTTSEYASVLDEHESICYPGWFKLPEAQIIIFDLMRMVQGVRLGRVLITRLAPGKRIAPHVDGGSHADYYERYHFILQNLPGSVFRAGDESITAQAGEVWWFDNKKEHEVVNNSADDKLALIIDIRCIK
jgi:hypothetical protein